MSITLIWLLPAAAFVVLIGVLSGFATKAKKLLRQSSRLSRALNSFQPAEHAIPNSFELREFEEPDAAKQRRRNLLRKQAKTKTERQRRLVKRLRYLSAKERE